MLDIAVKNTKLLPECCVTSLLRLNTRKESVAGSHIHILYVLMSVSLILVRFLSWQGFIRGRYIFVFWSAFISSGWTSQKTEPELELSSHTTGGQRPKPRNSEYIYIITVFQWCRFSFSPAKQIWCTLHLTAQETRVYIYVNMSDGYGQRTSKVFVYFDSVSSVCNCSVPSKNQYGPNQ